MPILHPHSPSRRWGDKTHEMHGLVPINTYVKAVKYLINKHKLLDPIAIFLTTEDENASTAFRSHPDVKSNNWTVYEYRAAVSPLNHMHTPAIDAQRSRGHFGLISMIVLLLSLESKYYIVTTASNWSYVIAALRSGIVDPDCGGCTDWIDLRHTPLLTAPLKLYNQHNKISVRDCPLYPYNQDGMLFPQEDCSFRLQ